MDYAKTIEYYQKAAELAGEHTYMNIGNLYLNGQGADLDVVKGLEWYAKAEEARAE